MRTWVSWLAAASAVFLLSSQLSAQAQPAGLVIKMGETWIFRIVDGQPVSVHAAGPQDVPQRGEMKVSLQPQMGMTMVITNNTSEWYNYRAFLAAGTDPMGLPTSVCTLMADGKLGVETWPRAAPAIRIVDFQRAEPGKMMCR